MRLLLIIVLGVLVVTYGWGWMIHVSEGPMSTARYTNYYLRELDDQLKYWLEIAWEFVKSSTKPLDPKTLQWER